MHLIAWEYPIGTHWKVAVPQLSRNSNANNQLRIGNQPARAGTECLLFSTPSLLIATPPTTPASVMLQVAGYGGKATECWKASRTRALIISCRCVTNLTTYRSLRNSSWFYVKRDIVSNHSSQNNWIPKLVLNRSSISLSEQIQWKICQGESELFKHWQRFWNTRTLTVFCCTSERCIKLRFSLQCQRSWWWLSPAPAPLHCR